MAELQAILWENSVGGTYFELQNQREGSLLYTYLYKLYKLYKHTLDSRLIDKSLTLSLRMGGRIQDHTPLDSVPNCSSDL